MGMRKFKPIYIVLLAATLVFQSALIAPAGSSPVEIKGEYVPNQIIVGYRATNSESEIAAVKEQTRRDVAARSFSQISPLARDTELIELGQGLSVSDALSRLSGRPGIRFVEPNFIYTSFASSNDTYFTNGSLWGMYGSSTLPANQFGSNAAAAWEKGYTGSSDVVIGVIDEGIQINHPDLKANIWSNPYEVPGDRIDNDGNGFIDDINGWDFVSNNNSVYDGTGDDHGTHVAGTIGAKGGNSAGVAGVNWDIKMISAKFLGTNGGTTTNAIRAVDYLTNLKLNRGVNIVATSNSWGGGGFSQSLLDAINRGGDAGILFIAAAGNSSANLDATNSYPAGYQCTTQVRSWDCVLSVASITSTGALSSFSNYGASRVDLGAPGSGISSTLPDSKYGSYSGTSMATPHVTGAAALCKAVNPTILAADIRNAIVNSTAPTTSLTGKTVTGGRLDVLAMSNLCAPTTSLLNQDPITITNSEITELDPTSTVEITSSEGSGTGAKSYNVSGSNCNITNTGQLSLTNTSTPVNCSVTVTKAGDALYYSSTSAPVVFNFVGNQLVLTLTPSAGSFPKGSTGILLGTVGGSGSGAVTYALSTPTQCVIRSNRLTVDKRIKGTVLCTVTATKAASTNYRATSSHPVTYTFN